MSRSAPVGLLRGFPLWAFRLRWVRACYAPTTPQQQHNNTTPTPTPYSTSTRSRLLYTPTFLPTSRQTYWVTTTSMADEARPASPGEAILASLPRGARTAATNTARGRRRGCAVGLHHTPPHHRPCRRQHLACHRRHRRRLADSTGHRPVADRAAPVATDLPEPRGRCGRRRSCC